MYTRAVFTSSSLLAFFDDTFVSAAPVRVRVCVVCVYVCASVCVVCGRFVCVCVCVCVCIRFVLARASTNRPFFNLVHGVLK